MISPFAPWYRTGTVAVTNGSTTVTGTGTAWTFGANVREGDLFTLNGAQFYEIAAATATTLTLRTPYLGTTASAQTYAIIRNFAVVPATEIIIRCLETTDIWKTFQDKMYDWQTKPYNATTPATVTFTGLDGAPTVLKSLPQVIGETNVASYKGAITTTVTNPAASTQALDWSAAGHREVTIDKTTTLTFTAPATKARLTLMLYRSGAGPYTVTLPSTVRDKSGANLASITLNTAAQAIDLLWNGTNYYRMN